MRRQKLFKRIENNPLLKVILREVNRMASSWVYLFITLIAPLLSFYLIMSIFSEGVPRNLSVATVDLDLSALSRTITRSVDATAIAKVDHKCISLEEAEGFMRKGEVDAILYIPRDAERDVVRGDSPKLALYINNTNIAKGGQLQSGIYRTLATISTSIKWNIAVKNGANAAQAISQVMPVKLESHLLFNPYGSYSYFLAAALIPLMVVVVTLLGSIYAIGTELKEGTGPKWLAKADNSITIAVFGKLIPYTFLFMVNVMVMFVILFRFWGTPIKGSIGMILLSSLMMVITYQLIAVFMVAATSNMRLSLSLASAYTMMALTFSGLTFPLMSMPLVAKVFAHIFPFTYWLKIFIGQSMRGESLYESIIPMMVLLVFIAFSIAFFPTLKRKLLNDKYWGRI